MLDFPDWVNQDNAHQCPACGPFCQQLELLNLGHQWWLKTRCCSCESQQEHILDGQQLKQFQMHCLMSQTALQWAVAEASN